jgi:hypothetical protein
MAKATSITPTIIILQAYCKYKNISLYLDSEFISRQETK